MKEEKQIKKFIFKFYMNNGEMVQAKDFIAAENVKVATAYLKFKLLFNSRLTYSNGNVVIVVMKKDINFFTVETAD